MTAKLQGKITAKVSMQVYAELQAQAQVQGLTISELVRNTLDAHFRNEAARLGVPVVSDTSLRPKWERAPNMHLAPGIYLVRAYRLHRRFPRR